MREWFTELHTKRIAWIDATRQNDFERGIKNLTVDKYTEPLHFIYELLQNAEDQYATSVQFSLYEKHLEFCHNGDPFSQADVESITGIGNTQKAGQGNKIGCFGIGFKSVFEITDCPEIYASLDDEFFGFAIRDQVVPETLEYVADDFKMGWTRFVFPFKPKADDLYGQIKTKLRELGADTLLFLNQLKEIHWETQSEQGTYLCERSDPPYEYCHLISESGAKGEYRVCDESNYLRFSRQTSVDGGKNRAVVRLAFRLEANNIVAEEGLSVLNVFFPTSEKTNLRFRLHAPMLLTDSRANIKTDNPINAKLIEDCATLLAESLPLLKRKDLLNSECLDCLPIRQEDFPLKSTFRPLFDKVAEALRNQELLPTATGSSCSHVRATNARISEASTVRELLDETQLSLLDGQDIADPICWLSGKIREQVTKDLWHYLQGELKVKKIDLDTFCGMLSVPFLQQQSDTWMQQFYATMLDSPYLWEKGRSNPRLRKKEFIRLEDSSHVTPFKQNDSHNAFLPASVDIGFPTVKRALLLGERGDNALKFLRNLGLIQPSIVDQVLHHVLPKYDRQLEFNQLEYLSDIILIAEATELCPSSRHDELESMLKKTHFVSGYDTAMKKPVWKRPKDIYQTSPSLCLWFEDFPDAFIVCELLENQNAWTTICDFINRRSMTIANTIRVRARSPEGQGYVTLVDSHGKHERGLQGFDPTAMIDGLEHALENITVERARILWHILLDHLHVLKGTVEKSSYQDFRSSTEDRIASCLYDLCTAHQWMPDTTGGFHRPANVSLRDLPFGFDIESVKASLLSEALDMVREDAWEKENEEREYAEYKENRPDFIAWKREREQAVLPDTNADYSSERGRKLSERQKESPDVTYEKRLRSIRTSSSVLRSEDKQSLIQYCTNENNQMICQICREPMPFKVNGLDYFEAVHFCKRNVKEVIRNKIALCPLCAAKWLYANEQTSEDLLQKLSLCRPGESITILLADRPENLHFWGNHLGDLKSAFEYEKIK